MRVKACEVVVLICWPYLASVGVDVTTTTLKGVMQSIMDGQ